MSNSVDERIVQMQFNNKQFEDGVQESLGSLDKLKKGLNLNESAKSLTNLQAAGDKFSLAGIANGVDTIASKFTAFGIIGVTALANLANAAINTGVQIVKSLAVDPIALGYGDFERKLSSVQTIMASTGKSLPEVDGYFGQLDEYADQTIYNLDDMTSALAKFTNAGVDLDLSVPAIKGIANSVALAGQGSNAAAIAMYNLSQSIAGGFLTTMDYRSLNLANVATKEWKQNLVDAAVAAGTLIDVGDGMYLDAAGQMREALPMQRLFTESLSTGWATTEVLLDVYGQYGDATTEIGKKAQAAATDVKSYGMMMETLQAAVGTGWTESFENVIGNLEESKALWTGLTTVISGFLDSTSDARNASLKFWKDNGGRDKLIQGIADAFGEVSRIFKSLKGAFDKVFPPVTGETLLKLSNTMSDFLTNFKMGDKDLANLTRTAAGLFAGLKLGSKILGVLWEGLGKVGEKLKPLFSALLEITAGWGDFWVELNNSSDATAAFDQVLADLSAAIDTVAANISEAFDTIKEKTKDIPDEIAAAFEKIKTTFDDLKTIDTSGLDTFIEDIRERFKPIDEIIKFSTSALEKIREAMNSLAPFFKGVGDKLEDASDNVNPTSLLAVLQSGGLTAVIVMLGSFVTSLSDITSDTGGLIKSLTKITDDAGGFLDNIKSILDGVRGCLTAWQDDIKAGTLMKIAIAVGILAGALVLLASIDPEKMTAAIVGMTTLFAELVGSMAIFTTIVSGDGFKSMVVLTSALISFSIAILLLSKAASILGQLNWEQLAVGLAGVTGLIGEMIVASKLLANQSAGMITSGVGLILFAAAIKLLADSVATLGQLSWEGLARGMLGVVGIAAMLMAMMKFGDFGGASIQMGVGLMLLAGAIGMLAGAVALLGLINPAQLAFGMLALSGIILLITTFTRVVGDGSTLIQTGIGMVFIAGAMVVFALAVQMLGAIPLPQLAAGLIALALGLTMMIVALNFMPPNIIVGAAAFALMAVGLLGLALALQMIASVPAANLAAALITIAASLLVLVVAVTAMTGAIVGAAALLIISVGLMALAVALQMIGSMSLEQIGIALLGLVAVLVVFGLAALAMTPILIPMAALAAVMLLLGIAMMAIGAAAIIMAIGMTMMSTVGLAGVATMIAITLAMSPLILLSPGLLILGAALVVVSLGVLMLGLGFTVLGGGIATIVAMGPGGIATLTQLAELAVSISAFAAQILAAGVGLTLFGLGAMMAGTGALFAGIGLLVLGTGLKAFMGVDFTSFTGVTTFANDLLSASLVLLLAAPGLTAGGAALLVFGAGAIASGVGLALMFLNITATVEAIKQAPDEISSSGTLILAGVDAIMAGITALILAKGPRIKAAFLTVCASATSAIGTQRSNFVNAGINLVNGFADGITSQARVAIEAAQQMAKDVTTATETALDINSPSKVFDTIAFYTVKGLANGLLGYAALAEKAATTLAKTTITPVMDMSKTSDYAQSVKPFATHSTSTPEISKNLQNGGLMQRTLSSLSDLATTNSDGSPTDISGVLTIQLINDKGEIIGIAEQAIKDLLRRESR